MATAREHLRLAEQLLARADEFYLETSRTPLLLESIANGVIAIGIALGAHLPPIALRLTDAPDRCICRPDGSEQHATDCSDNDEAAAAHTATASDPTP